MLLVAVLCSRIPFQQTDRSVVFTCRSCNWQNKAPERIGSGIKEMNDDLKSRSTSGTEPTATSGQRQKPASKSQTKPEAPVTATVKRNVEQAARIRSLEMMYCGYHAKNPAVVQCNQCARWCVPPVIIVFAVFRSARTALLPAWNCCVTIPLRLFQ